MFYTGKTKTKTNQPKKRKLTGNEKGIQNEVENLIMPL